MRVAGGISAAGSRRALSASVRSALEHTVEFWHRVFMPRHFEDSASARYGYQKRSGEGEPEFIRSLLVDEQGRGYYRMLRNRKYYWRKKRQKGHTKPLVWSGASEASAKRSVWISSRRSRPGIIAGEAAMELPRYFYQYRKDLGQPNKADELTRVSADEVVTLTEVMNRAVARALPRELAGEEAAQSLRRSFRSL